MRRLAPPLLLLAAALLPPVLAQDGGAADPFGPAERDVLDKALRFERELVRLVEKVRPSSVTIENWQNRGGALMAAGAGSGVIISSKGHVLTNQHVVQGAVEVWVVLSDHRRCRARVIGADERGDISLLQIDEDKIRHADPRKGRPDSLSPGEWVIATGNPFFQAADGEAVVTLGVVSGLERVVPGEFFYGDAVQHDAKINPGNSGGPLWDSEGELLGINGKIAGSPIGQQTGRPSSSGVGYTIPIDQVRNFFEAMFEGRKVQHGDELLGIKAKTSFDEDGLMQGVEVTEVAPGSPAAEARAGGVMVGDVIVAVGIEGRRKVVRNMTKFIAVLSPLVEGSRVTLTVKRGYKRLVVPNIKLVPPRKPKGGRK